MILSLSSVIAAFLQCGIIVVLLQLLLKLSPKKFAISPQLLYSIGLLIFIRILLPVEFPFTITITSSTLFPPMYALLNYSLFSVTDLEITLWQVMLLIFCFIGTHRLIKFAKTYLVLKTYIDSLKTTELNTFNHDYVKNISYQVVASPYVTTPAIYGVFQPIIILPTENDFNEREMSYIILHELTHFKKRDTIFKIFLEAFSCFFWWNPVIIIFIKQMNKILELRIDNEMMKHLTPIQCVEYAECLLRVNQEQSADPQKEHLVLNYMQRDKNIFELRINKILSFQPISASSKAITLFLLILTIISMLFVIEPYTVDKETKQTTFSMSDNLTTFFVKNTRGTYSVYVNSDYKGDVINPEDSPGVDIPKIYDSLEEALKYN